MRILVLGANGQVGFELLRALDPLASPSGVVAATREGTRADGSPSLRADLADPSSLAQALADADADVVVNAAAYTAVDRAEDEPALADRVNRAAVGEIGAWAARRGALVVHYSTDYVFDGRATRPYREDDATAPLGVYGATKLAGEGALRASGAAHLILRTAWVYAARGRNFLRTMLRLAGERGELRVVGDQVGAPTPARWIAAATAAAVASLRGGAGRAGVEGTYHLVAAGQCSWCGFAEAIVDEAARRGLVAAPPRVVPVATAEFPTRARRPAYSVLDCSRFQRAFGLQLPSWREGLSSVLDEWAGPAGGARDS
jgi:dTDP-4-dehydrorhamnose reductase